ncbi:hypothetical protein EVAR_21481_1, partial [Eumeta japonica]
SSSNKYRERSAVRTPNNGTDRAASAQGAGADDVTRTRVRERRVVARQSAFERIKRSPRRKPTAKTQPMSTARPA